MGGSWTCLLPGSTKYVQGHRKWFLWEKFRNSPSDFYTSLDWENTQVEPGRRDPDTFSPCTPPPSTGHAIRRVPTNFQLLPEEIEVWTVHLAPWFLTPLPRGMASPSHLSLTASGVFIVKSHRTHTRSSCDYGAWELSTAASSGPSAEGAAKMPTSQSFPERGLNASFSTTAWEFGV